MLSGKVLVTDSICSSVFLEAYLGTVIIFILVGEGFYTSNAIGFTYYYNYYPIGYILLLYGKVENDGYRRSFLCHASKNQENCLQKCVKTVKKKSFHTEIFHLLY